MGEECIVMDEISKKPVIAESLCVGCGICSNKCPFEAIIITNLPTETGVLTHQYGENAFRLYGLPIPTEGKVTGIIGPNGIGKSTAALILTNQLKPNLGDYENGASLDWNSIIENYRGNEIQKYLKLLSGGGLRTVYKPQHVDAIPKEMKGTVNEILDKIKIKNSELIKELGISKCLDNRLDELSGGELNSRNLLFS